MDKRIITPMKKVGLIFDLDGTLWDATAPVAEAWQEVCREMIDPSFTLTKEETEKFMGLTMVEIGQRLSNGVFRGVDFERFMKRCFDYEVEYLTTHPGDLYPHELEVLAELKKQGYPLFIVSNCQLGYIDNYLAIVPPLFDGFLCYGHTNKEKSVTIAKMMEMAGLDAAIYIGDTAGDENASHKAGCPFIYARYGFGQSDNHEGVIDSFDDLPSEIERLKALFL